MTHERRLVAGLLAATLCLPVSAVEKISVLGLFKDKAVLTIDGKRRVLSAGETSPEGVRLVSADSEAAVLEVDGQRGHYRLGSHISSTFTAPEAGAAAKIWPTPDGMYSVTGSINGYPVDFLVDTGATLVAMNRNQARRLGIDHRVEGEPGMSSTASGLARTWYVTLDRVRVGDIALRNVKAAVLDGDFPTEVLLGMSFLNRVDMRRDGRLLELRKKY